MAITFLFNMLISGLDMFISGLPNAPIDPSQFTAMFQSFAIMNRIVDLSVVVGTLLMIATATSTAYAMRSAVDIVMKTILNLIP